jgi:ABC-2 type transport system ATP-binding protein
MDATATADSTATANTNAIAIEVTGLKKTFQIKKPRGIKNASRLRNLLFPAKAEVEAVSGIDLKVTHGEALAFIGPNGAGKSTTIKMLTGILYPSAGEARVLGLTPWKDRKKLAYRIGTVFGQKSQLWLHLPAMHTFDLLARAYELDLDRYKTQRDKLIEFFELGDLVHVPVRKLSLGQRMRCEIVASLLHEPEVLFLDEPTIGLDPLGKSMIRDLIRRTNREQGVTVFLTSHDAGDVENVCRRVVVVNEGHIVLDDSIKSLQRNYLREREIDLKLQTPFEGEIDIPGVKPIKIKGFGVKFSVDPSVTPIDRAVGELLQKLAIEDIVIQTPPLEEVIAAIYRNKSGARG